MSGAVPLGVKGGDAKARDNARKHGLSLGDWLNQAILAHEEAVRQADGPSALALSRPDIEPSDEWRAGHEDDNERVRSALDALAQRLAITERRQALAVTGLDRTVLGLAARVEEAEAGAKHANATVNAVVGDIRRAAVEIVERLEDTESLARTAADAAENARSLSDRLDHVQEDLRRRVDEATLEAERAGETLIAHLRAAQADLAARVEASTAQARAAAEGAVDSVRADQERLSQRLAAAESAGQSIAADVRATLSEERDAIERRLAETAAASEAVLAALRREHAVLSTQVAEASANAQSEARESLQALRTAQQDLAVRLAAGETEARDLAAQAQSELARQQAALDARLAAMEESARETAANLRAGAAAAINQVRASQLELAKRLEETSAAVEAQAELEARIDRIERESNRGADRAALHMLDAKITSLASAVRESRDKTQSEIDALKLSRSPELEERIRTVELGVEASLQRLSERLAHAEASANVAIRSLEEAAGARAETAALRTMVEQRLDTMAANVSEIVGDVRAEFATRLASAGRGEADAEAGELAAAVADVNRRLASAERRQAQTIEAISIEITRMSEGVDRRLRALESRNDAAAGEAVREEVSRLAETLEARIADIQTRDAAGFDRMGVEMGRLAERFDERFVDVERRSAEALETIGEQVARNTERLTQRQEQMARELTEQIVESEERQGQRLSTAIDTIGNRIAEVEERQESALTPVQRAMSGLAARLQAIEAGTRGALEELEPERYAPQAPMALEPMPLSEEDVCAEADAVVDLEEISPAPELDVAAEPALVAIEADERSAPEALAEAPEPAFDALEEDLAEPDFGEVEPVEGATVAKDDDAAIDDDLPWEEPASATAPRTAEREFDTPAGEDLFAEADLPPAKNDYLAAARRAAQAQSAPRRGGGEGEAASGLSLRGRNRIVLWGAAAGLVAVATIAGGSLLMRPKPQPTETAVPPPAPVPTPAPVLDSTPPIEVPAASEPEAASTPSSIAAAAEAAKKSTPAPAAKPSPAPVESKKDERASSMKPGAASLEVAAARGDAVAQYELALQRIQAGRRDEATDLLKRSANQGLAMAQYRLGKLYERGEGVTPDITLARQWTERAAAAGNRKAMHDLGVFYARGEGAPLDEATAFRWFRQAAELGVADSQYNLGILYLQGRGVTANPSEALFWFSIAAKAGDQDARARADALTAQLGAGQAGSIVAKAEGFAPKPASARANGEFGQRIWSREAAEARGQRRS